MTEDIEPEEDFEDLEPTIYDAHFSTTPLPGAGRVDWQQVMEGHHARYAAPADANDDDTPKFTVTSSRMDVDPKTVSDSPKKTLKAVAALKWKVLGIQETITHHEPTLQMSDGKVKKDGSQALKGDVKTAAHDDTHIFITVTNPTRQVGFQASWVGGRFEGVTMHDPIGFPRELFCDYTPSAERKKTLGAKVAIELAEGYNFDYNDGVSRLAKTHYTTVAGEFTAWLDDWLNLATKNEEAQNDVVGTE